MLLLYLQFHLSCPFHPIAFHSILRVHTGKLLCMVSFELNANKIASFSALKFDVVEINSFWDGSARLMMQWQRVLINCTCTNYILVAFDKNDPGSRIFIQLHPFATALQATPFFVNTFHTLDVEKHSSNLVSITTTNLHVCKFCTGTSHCDIKPNYYYYYYYYYYYLK